MYKGKYKPSKELLEVLLLYADLKELGKVLDLNHKTVAGCCKIHGIDTRNLKAIRERSGNKKIPQMILDRIEAERMEFRSRIQVKLKPDECLSVPEDEPEPEIEKPSIPKLNTHDIKALIHSDNAIDFLYVRRITHNQDFYGGYLGVSNRRNSKGASDRNFKAVRLA